MRPPPSWSIEGSWCCGAPSLLGSKMTSGLGLQGFRAEPTAPTQVMESLERCRVKTLREVPGRPQGRRGGGVQACRWNPGLWGKLLEGPCLLVSIPHEGRE